MAGGRSGSSRWSPTGRRPGALGRVSSKPRAWCSRRIHPGGRTGHGWRGGQGGLDRPPSRCPRRGGRGHRGQGGRRGRRAGDPLVPALTPNHQAGADGPGPGPGATARPVEAATGQRRARRRRPTGTARRAPASPGSAWASSASVPRPDQAPGGSLGRNLVGVGAVGKLPPSCALAQAGHGPAAERHRPCPRGSAAAGPPPARAGPGEVAEDQHCPLAGRQPAGCAAADHHRLLLRAEVDRLGAVAAGVLGANLAAAAAAA